MSQFYDQASLVMIPSGYKNGKVYSQKPLSADGELTFTRASNASRVNADGLVERVRTNLILQSNTFSTTWTNTGTTETGGQEGYDGTNNAWKLTKSASSGRLQQGTFNAGVYSFSIYLKADTNNWVQLYLDTTTPNDPSAFFDLQNGLVGTTSYNIDAKIEAVGETGWYRCSVVGNITTTFVAMIFPAEADNDKSASSGSVYIQDAQLEAGDIATDYIPTTTSARSTFAGITVDGTSVPNVPRLDYSGGATCPRLLLEPQTTALNQFSEQLDNAYWTKTDVTISANTTATLDPSGYNGADKVVEAATTNYHSFQRTITTAVTSHTFSVFAKAAERSIVYIEVFTSSASNRTFFDLSNGTIGTSSAGNNPTITEYGNGWYRLSVTRATGASSVFIVGVTTTDNVLQYAGNGTSGAYLWGLNCTQTSYLQSYIPTLSAAVTRLADAGTTSIPSLINASEGVLYLEYTPNSLTSGTFPVDFQLQYSGTSATNGVTIYQFGAVPSASVRSGGSVIAILSGTSVSVGVRTKLALAYKENDFVLYQNGVQVGSDTSGAAPLALNEIRISDGTRYFSINQALLFKTRLTNAQLAELTTL